MMYSNAKAVSVVIALVYQATLVVGQLFFGFPAANECRHNSLFSRASLHSPFSTRCFLPSQKRPWRDFSIKGTIEKDWKWALEHNGAISGQVIVAGNNFVYMLSQKLCVDRGKGLGRPMNLLYRDINATAKPIGYAGDFNTVTVVSEPYSDCVFNKKQWQDYIVLNTTENISRRLPPEAVQYVRIHMGQFTGDGDILAPHSFNYSALDIEKAFQSAIDHSISDRRKQRPIAVKVKPGKPIFTDTYPFETGLSIISVADNLQGHVHRQIRQDVSTLGWNRALTSVKSHGGRPYPPPQFPDHMKLFEVLGIVVFSFVSIVSFQQVAELAFSTRRMNIGKWTQESSGTWARIKSRQDYFEGTSFFANGHADVIGVCLGFLGAVITILVAIRELLGSDLVYSEHAIISQSGVITHGSSNPNLSIDRTNVVSGTEFAVSHWYLVQFKTFGRKGGRECIIFLCFVFLGFVCRQFYLLSLKMEHKFDHPFIQSIALVSRHIIHAAKVVAAFAQVVPALLCGSDRKSKLVFYEDELSEVRGVLFERYHIVALLGPVDRSLWDINSVPVLPYREGQVECGSTSSSETVTITVNEVEKCAAILTAAAYGRLTFPQVLTLMCSPSLQNAVDCYISRGTLPETKRIKQLALIYYVGEVLVPSIEANRGDVMDFTPLNNLDKEHGIAHEIHPEYAMSQETVLAPILGLDEDTYNLVQGDALHDRIKYATFPNFDVGNAHRDRRD